MVDSKVFAAAVEAMKSRKSPLVDHVSIEDGIAVFRNKHGRPVGFMSAGDYERLCEERRGAK
jgi:hypothetical protein